MLLDFHTLDLRCLQLLHRRQGVIPVIGQLLDHDAVTALQVEDVVLDKAVVDRLIAAGVALAAFDQVAVVDLLLAGLQIHARLGDETDDLGVDLPVDLAHHRDGCVVIRLGQVKAQVNGFPLPPAVRHVVPAQSDFLDIHEPLDAEPLIEDVAVLAQEVFSLAVVEDRQGSLFLQLGQQVLVIHGDRVALEKDPVVCLPGVSLFEVVIRLVQQGKVAPIVGQPVQRLLGDVDLGQHHVVVVWVLRADDDPELAREVDLRGPHRLDRVVIHRPGLVGEESVGHAAVHPVAAVGQRGVLGVVDRAADLTPEQLKGRIYLIAKRGARFDDLPDRVLELRGERQIRAD